MSPGRIIDKIKSYSAVECLVNKFDNSLEIIFVNPSLKFIRGIVHCHEKEVVVSDYQDMKGRVDKETVLLKGRPAELQLET